MKLADISIRRPVFATMMIAALVVLGLFSFGRLGVDLFPNIDFPIVTVSTTLKGASPEEIETSLTKPIEEAVNTISGIDELRSTSFEGLSQVIVTFVLEKNADVGAQEVRDAVSRVIRNLPQGTDPPVIQKFDPGASPVMSIAVSANRPLRDITELARKQIKEPLETLKGVGRITMVGGREREIHVVVDAQKLAALSLSIQQVKDALKQQNIEVPGGRVDQNRRELILRTMGRIEDPAAFGDVIVANRGGMPLRVRDVARVEDTEEEPRTMARLDGAPTVSLVVQKQSGANTVEVIRSVKEALAELRATLPPGLSARVVRDQSGFILSSVRTVEEHLILGALLASLVVLLFMGDWRSTLIASVAIPTSLIATFILMDLAGFTLNNMTLLALALAVGVVIDDAIVVLENIFRHMEEEGKPARQAAFEATDEIGLAVMATTVSLIIIFLPLAYMPGIVGRFLKSYGLTVAFAIGVSLFVAFSLTPMLCSRYLKTTTGPRHRLQIAVDRLNDWLKEGYGRLILWSLHRRWVLVVTAAGLILSTGVIIRHVGKDFIPPDDSSEFQVTLKTPEGTSLAMTSKILEQLEAELRRLPGVKSLLTSVGEGEGASVNDGLIYVRLEDLSQRKQSQFSTMAQARRAFAKYKGLRIGVAVISPISGGGFKDADFTYFLTGPDLKGLQTAAATIQARLKKIPGMMDVDSSLVFAKPELKVRINRERAQDLGVKVEDIANTLRTMVGGEEDITKYKEGDDLYQVRLRVGKDDRNRAEAISGLTVPSTRGLVRLDNVAALAEERGPAQIDRINRQRQVSFTANLQGLPIGDAIKKAEAITKSLHLPPEYKSGLLGKAKEFGRMIRGFLIAFGLAFIFMYMVLGAQFESFLHPVTILLSLPLSIPFALLSLLIVGQTLTIFSIMGVFMLFGIVKKNAILQVDYTNTLRSRGMDRNAAILEANKTRLRPILMTTLVLVAAMTPVALGKGPGAANRATMAVVIVGGQSLCLLITLLITPVAYSLFDDAAAWVKTKRSSGRSIHKF
ncbi:MAG: efflux RND transporter permease subunit [Elusimicrobia bacterium]|nr:efflux RND transporter permease subunit [Elusimicrobiota bacterium]